MTNYDIDAEERKANATTIKRGTWGGQININSFYKLPKRVQTSVEELESNEDETDWEYFATEGKTWIVVKLWDESGFEVVASEVKHIGKLIRSETYD